MSIDEQDWDEKVELDSAPSLSLNYGGGYFVATGEDGLLVCSTSIDGPWETISVPVSSAIYATHYADGKWVAVGGRVMTATNPSGTWTLNSSVPDNTLYGVTYGDGKWVAVGANGYVFTATNPTSTWTGNTSGTGSSTLNDVDYGDGKFALVGDSATIRYATDPTGTWSTPSSGSGVSGEAFRSVAYGDGHWLAVGTASSAGLARTATDPTDTWSTASPGGSFTSFGFGGGARYLDGTWALTGPGADEIRHATSIGGTWATISVQANTISYSQVAFGEGEWGILLGGGIGYQAIGGTGWGMLL